MAGAVLVRALSLSTRGGVTLAMDSENKAEIPVGLSTAIEDVANFAVTRG